MVTNDSEKAPRARSGEQEEPMSKGAASGQPLMFSRRLVKIMKVMERFREEAEQKGHLPFADALRSCRLENSGGTMDVPPGKFVVDEPAATAVLMAFNPTAPRPRRHNPPPPGGGRFRPTRPP